MPRALFLFFPTPSFVLRTVFAVGEIDKFFVLGKAFTVIEFTELADFSAWTKKKRV